MRFPHIVVSKYLIDHPDGALDDFATRFPTTNVKRRSSFNKHSLLLGKGQFGRVILVEEQDKNGNRKRFACKILPKGLVYEANVLYTPAKPQILRGEVDMLQTLRGQSYCLQIDAVYETRWAILVVTEVCDGGDLSTWAAHHRPYLTITMDVARLARQLYEAVAHCDDHGILHRDIKPDNVMFVHPGRTSDLRLIDFGSGCRDPMVVRLPRLYEDRVQHQTMAGTAFYTAPELFQRQYTALVDVWSAAVTLYVLVASYPAPHDQLQKAYNLLHKSARDVRTLPGHDVDGCTMDNSRTTSTALPDAYIDFLTQALTYWPASRPTARTLLQHDFVHSLSSSSSSPSLPSSPLHEKDGPTGCATLPALTQPLDEKTSQQYDVVGSNIEDKEGRCYQPNERHHVDSYRTWWDGNSIRLTSQALLSRLNRVPCSVPEDDWSWWCGAVVVAEKEEEGVTKGEASRSNLCARNRPVRSRGTR